MSAGRSSTGISPRPMLMGAPRNALRAFNAGVSLSCLRVIAHRLPHLFCGLVFVALLFGRGPVLRTCNRVMAHRPTGSTQTDRIRLPYAARRLSLSRWVQSPASAVMRNWWNGATPCPPPPSAPRRACGIRNSIDLLGKQIDTYRKLKPVYDRYKVSKDKEKFLRGFESEIILFEAAAREIKKAGLARLPSSEKLKAELDGLAAHKTALQAELRKIRREEKEYDTLRQNVDSLLERSDEQNQEHRREHITGLE